MKFFYFCLFCTFFTLGCEDTQKTALFKAQSCLNTATTEKAEECLSLIPDSDQSVLAQGLRCSILFLSQGITGPTLVKAMEDFEENDENPTQDDGNPTVMALGLLAMDSREVADKAVETCKKTGSPSMNSLAQFSKLATSAGRLAGVLDLKEEEQAEALEEYVTDKYDPDTADPTELGEDLIESKDLICDPETGLLKSTPACEIILDSTQGDKDSLDPKQVGNKFLENLKSNN